MRYHTTHDRGCVVRGVLGINRRPSFGCVSTTIRSFRIPHARHVDYENPFTSHSFTTPIPPPSALYPTTYFYSLSPRATLSPPYFFSVVSSVHRFSSLILRLVLYVLISDSTTFLALHSTAKMKHTVKKTIRESQAGKCPNRNIEIQLESEAMRLDINRVLLSKNGWSDGGGSSSLCLKMARSTSPMIGTWEDYIKSGHACDINCVRPYRRGRGRQLGSSEFERDVKNVFLCASCRS